MCGLFALADWSGLKPSQTDWAQAAREQLRVRGPDHDAVTVMPDGICVLAHTRLSILDPTPASDQPMVDPRTGVAIVFNGEIYNFKDLRGDLVSAGVEFSSTGDTETILQLYIHGGVEALAELRGMYAFALWDPRDRSLTVVRDPFGIKPLYLWKSGQAIAVASQIRALAAGLSAVEQDPEAVLEYAMFGHMPGERTPVRGVVAAAPGQIVQFRAGQPERRIAFADLRGLFSLPGGEKDDPAGISLALEESVSAHTLSDVPIGLLLSTGLDSGAIASRLAAAAEAAAIQTFTINFETGSGRSDERAGSAKIAAGLGFPSTGQSVSIRDMADSLPAYFQAMDCPTVDAINMYFAARLVGESGVKLALTGVGGDELLGSYPTFARTGWIASPVGRAGVNLALLARRAGLKMAFNSAKLNWMAAAGRTLTGAYLVQRGVCDPVEAARLYGCEASEAQRVFDRVHDELHAEAQGINNGWSAISYLETRFYLIPRLLRDADWAGMAHSVELRTPLVDWTLWTTARALLANARGERPASKRILLGPAIAENVAPFISTSKQGFDNPYASLVGLSGEPDAPGGAQQKWAKHVLEQWTLSLPRLSRSQAEPSRESPSPRVDQPIANADQSTKRSRPRVNLTTSIEQAPIRERSAAGIVETVVIFRLGSLGDTVNCLPCFHQIMRVFPSARRALLTNIPVSNLAPPAESVLRGGGFIQAALHYNVGERRIGKLLELRRKLRALDATTLIYLTEGRSLTATWRDVLFFRFCGFTRIIGAPITPGLFQGRRDHKTGDVEREIERLARCLSDLGPIDLQDPANWDLNLTGQERADADAFLAPLGTHTFIAINTGGKVKAKDWGEERWADLLARLSRSKPNDGLVVIGAADDSARAQRLIEHWRGPTLDLCGKLLPRQSAAVLARARLFVGHDSGPLHLSAAMGLTCVAMFGDYNRPKKWHPVGERHRIIHNMAGVMAITPDEVFEAVEEVLARGEACPAPSPSPAPQPAAP